MLKIDPATGNLITYHVESEKERALMQTPPLSMQTLSNENALFLGANWDAHVSGDDSHNVYIVTVKPVSMVVYHDVKEYKSLCVQLVVEGSPVKYWYNPITKTLKEQGFHLIAASDGTEDNFQAFLLNPADNVVSIKKIVEVSYF